MNDRHTNMARFIQQKALEALTGVDPQTLSPTEIVNWIERAMKAERRGRGEPEIVRPQQPGGKEAKPEEKTPAKRIRIVEVVVQGREEVEEFRRQEEANKKGVSPDAKLICADRPSLC